MPKCLGLWSLSADVEGGPSPLWVFYRQTGGPEFGPGKLSWKPASEKHHPWLLLYFFGCKQILQVPAFSTTLISLRVELWYRLIIQQILYPPGLLLAGVFHYSNRSEWQCCHEALHKFFCAPWGCKCFSLWEERWRKNVYIFNHVYGCGCVHMSASACRSQRWCMSLQLELQAVVSYLTWLLRSESRLSTRAECSLHH